MARPQTLSQNSSSMVHPYMNTPLLHDVHTVVYAAANNTIISDDAIKILADDDATVNDAINIDVVHVHIQVHIHGHDPK